MTFSWYTCRGGKLLSILCGACLLTNPGPVPAASALLEWDGVATDALATWVVYYGSAPRTYTNSFAAGLTNRAIVTTLVPGVTYYFAATARTVDGLESEFSNEVSYTAVPASTAPTVQPVADRSVSESSPQQTITLSGITSGSTLSQELSITAVSSNPQVIPHPAVTYSTAGTTAQLEFKPVPFAFGTAQITVTLRNAANLATTLQFNVQVTPVNQPPTLSPLPNLTLTKNSGTTPVYLTGITSGAPNEKDILTVTASSSDPAIIPHPHVTYSSPGQTATLLLTPAAGASGTASINVLVSDGQLRASQTFLLTLTNPPSSTTSTYLLNPGLFTGLFHEEDSLSYGRAGDFKIAISTRSTYSGRLRIGGATLSFSGKLDPTGRGTNVIKLSTNRLNLDFQMGSGTLSSEVQGTITDDTWSATLRGTQFTWNSRTNRALSSGAYTIVLPGAESSGSLPAGHGVGALRVTDSGIVVFSGSLGDRTRITWAGYLSPESQAPLFVPAHSGKGLLISWLQFANTEASDLSGEFTWIKPPNNRATYYPAGFSLEGRAIGSLYTRPTPDAPFVLDTPDAEIAFQPGTGPEPILNHLLFNSRGLPVNQGTNRMVLTFSTSTGLFTGSVIDPVSKRPLPFAGAILQKQAVGYGFVASTNQTTSLQLLPRPNDPEF